jgi:hypothetical protein
VNRRVAFKYAIPTGFPKKGNAMVLTINIPSLRDSRKSAILPNGPNGLSASLDQQVILSYEGKDVGKDKP